MQSFLNSLPENSFIRTFVDYYIEREESPSQYIVGSALHCMTSLAGRKCFVKLGSMRVYLPLYIVLVGRSGFMRKTSALKCAEENIFAIDKTITFPSDGISAGAFFDILIHKSHRSAICTELRQLIPHNSKTSDTRLIPLLTNLADCPRHISFSYRNRSKDGELAKTLEVKEPYFTMLGATTLEWFNIDPTDIAGGFMGRVLPILATEKDKRMIVIPPDDNPEIIKKIHNYLTCLKVVSAHLKLSADAEIIYKQKYHEFEHLASTSPNDLLCTIYSRLQIYLLKLSMLVELSSNVNASEISKDSINSALILLKIFIGWYEKLIIHDMSFSATDRLIKKICEIIRRKPGINSREMMPLCQYIYKQPIEYTSAIATLTSQKRIKLLEGGYWICES